MKRFDLGGMIALVVLAVGYLVATLATGYSATSQAPVDLAAHDQGLDVYQSVALLVEQGDGVAVLDTRPRAQFAAYHLPQAVSLPDATPARALRALGERRRALIIGKADAQAAELAAGVAALDAQRELHFVRGGARALYLAFELPVAAFTDRDAPFGYTPAVATVRSFLASGKAERPAAVLAAVRKLATLDYAPTELSGAKPKGAGKKKKISGGCG